MNEWWPVMLIAGASYLLGAIPFGLLAGLMRGIDLRKAGSGNIGATNAWRLLGPAFGLPVFVLDFLKGCVPVWVGRVYLADHAPLAVIVDPALMSLLVVLVGAAAVLGHMFPVYLNFRGGKGAATGLGLLFALHPPTALCALGVWLLALGIWRYVSLASIIAALSYPVLFPALTVLGGDAMTAHWATWGGATLLCGLVVIRHRPNIARLLAGTEARIGAPPTPQPGAAGGAPGE